MPDTQTLISCGFAALGAAALLGSWVRHAAAARRQKLAEVARAQRERQRFHTMTAMLKDVSQLVDEASQRADDKLASLERVLRQAEQRATRLQRALDRQT